MYETSEFGAPSVYLSVFPRLIDYPSFLHSSMSGIIGLSSFFEKVLVAIVSFSKYTLSLSLTRFSSESLCSCELSKSHSSLIGLRIVLILELSKYRAKFLNCSESLMLKVKVLSDKKTKSSSKLSYFGLVVNYLNAFGSF